MSIRYRYSVKGINFFMHFWLVSRFFVLGAQLKYYHRNISTVFNVLALFFYFYPIHNFFYFLIFLFWCWWFTALRRSLDFICKIQITFWFTPCSSLSLYGIDKIQYVFQLLTVNINSMSFSFLIRSHTFSLFSSSIYLHHACAISFIQCVISYLYCFTNLLKWSLSISRAHIVIINIHSSFIQWHFHRRFNTFWILISLYCFVNVVLAIFLFHSSIYLFILVDFRIICAATFIHRVFAPAVTRCTYLWNSIVMCIFQFCQYPQ